MWSSDFALEDCLMYEHHDIWLQNKFRSLWPVFHGPVILPYILKTIWCMNNILWDYELVWHKIWNQNKCRSLWPMFHGPVILPNILKTVFMYEHHSQNDPTFDFKINVGCCDQYFMVQWFCLIFWRLCDVWISYFGIMSRYDTKFKSK